MKMRLVAATALVAGSGLFAGTAIAGAVITYGSTSLGVNDRGELNFDGVGPGGPLTYGVYRAGVGDAISPGCACEGWGVAVTSDGLRAAGFANQSSGTGGLTGGTFGSTVSTATSQVSLTDAPVDVRHAYGPSLAADLFQVQVTITNSGSETLEDVVYRRAMDWDVPPTEFAEFVTHAGVEANLIANGGNLLYASNNGFASSDPRSPADVIEFFDGEGDEDFFFDEDDEFFDEEFVDPEALVGASEIINRDFVDLGPEDHGSVFDFAFGDLAPGASRIFNIFYGSSASEGGALAQIAAVGADVYSLGQNSLPGGETSGTPATFVFAFGGVGGIEPGLAPDIPILPFVAAPGVFTFDALTPRRWYDPPIVDTFEYALTDGVFLEVMGAPGFDDLSVIVDGVVVEDDLDSGESYFFDPADMVSTFLLSGISPTVDAGDPTAFPTFLDFSAGASGLVMTGLTSAPPPPPPPSGVPLPASLALLAAGLPAILVARRQRTKN